MRGCGRKFWLASAAFYTEKMTRRRLHILLGAALPAMAQRTDDLMHIPANLPVPLDDGACDHLPGMRVPDIALKSTSGRAVSLAQANPGRWIVYAYPRTGTPDKQVPSNWDSIPGARGCTPQSCSMRDHYREVKSLGADIFGLSTQTTEYQKEMTGRLHLPFEVLSDVDLKLTHALNLPTFEFDGMTLIKRLTFVVKDGKIEKVFYPVFPPDQHGEQIVAWLKHKRGASA
jgi:peroxiredoxin